MSQDKLYEVLWTDLADYSYEKELEFIEKKWNEHEVIKFMILANNFIEKLEFGIIGGTESEQTKINSFVISKQTTLFFEIEEDKKEITLLLFWNNSKDDKKLAEIIKKFN